MPDGAPASNTLTLGIAIALHHFLILMISLTGYLKKEMANSTPIQMLQYLYDSKFGDVH